MSPPHECPFDHFLRESRLCWQSQPCRNPGAHKSISYITFQKSRQHASSLVHLLIFFVCSLTPPWHPALVPRLFGPLTALLEGPRWSLPTLGGDIALPSQLVWCRLPLALKALGRTCLSGSMLAKPPTRPPLDPMLRTSSRGLLCLEAILRVITGRITYRLAKLPGFGLSAMLLVPKSVEVQCQ